jgi:hypothetical protein
MEEIVYHQQIMQRMGASERRAYFNHNVAPLLGNVDSRTQAYREAVQQSGFKTVFSQGMTRAGELVVLASPETKRILESF